MTLKNVPRNVRGSIGFARSLLAVVMAVDEASRDVIYEASEIECAQAQYQAASVHGETYVHLNVERRAAHENASP